MAILWFCTTLLVMGSPQLFAQIEEKDQVQNPCRTQSVERYGLEAVRIGGDIEPPKKLIDVPPDYPRLPEGTTVFGGMWAGEFLVGPKGNVVEAWITKELKFEPPFPEFNEAILEAMRKWEFEPVIVDDEAAPVCITVVVNINWS